MPGPSHDTENTENTAAEKLLEAVGAVAAASASSSDGAADGNGQMHENDDPEDAQTLDEEDDVDIGQAYYDGDDNDIDENDQQQHQKEKGNDSEKAYSVCFLKVTVHCNSTAQKVTVSTLLAKHLTCTLV